MPKYVVLIGPPGAGKGTQAQLISSQLGLVHISSGDIFRQQIKAQTELGILAQSFIDHGNLVPDEVTVKMVRARLAEPDCQIGVLLDGFPRTLPQAQIFAQMLIAQNQRIQQVIYLAVLPTVLVQRLSTRLNCRAHGHVFNENFNPPQQAGICDLDGSELYLRDDDRPETVQKRIEIYLAQTAPLIEYYRSQNLLTTIEGDQPKEKVAQGILASLVD